MNFIKLTNTFVYIGLHDFEYIVSSHAWIANSISQELALDEWTTNPEGHLGY